VLRLARSVPLLRRNLFLVKNRLLRETRLSQDEVGHISTVTTRKHKGQLGKSNSEKINATTKGE
jgi:hypothetical protein